jgi:hypothetical protein
VATHRCPPSGPNFPRHRACPQSSSGISMRVYCPRTYFEAAPISLYRGCGAVALANPARIPPGHFYAAPDHVPFVFSPIGKKAIRLLREQRNAEGKRMQGTLNWKATSGRMARWKMQRKTSTTSRFLEWHGGWEPPLTTLRVPVSLGNCLLFWFGVVCGLSCPFIEACQLRRSIRLV